jgi:putative YphP/YqiW family bacilliredoxin
MNMFFKDQMNLMVQPMREELTRNGFTELRTPEEVDEAFQNMQGSALVVVNSVCGYAAGLARPGAIASLDHPHKPEQLLTVFAGQDREATQRAREYFDGEPPSSPSFVVMKDGQFKGIVHRHEVEDHELEEIVEKLHALYDEHCA